jgi:hypothetical protein
VTVPTAPRTNPGRRRLTDEADIRFGLANGVIVTALIVAWAAGLDVSATAVLAVLVAGLASGRLPIATAVALGFIAWAYFTGFVENRYGELTFANADLRRLATFALATPALSVFLRHIFHNAQEPARG